ncbi:hypothetical protein BIV57_00440 [Mangrovactinospora gilvigrisea]|uniref:Uncharacterized protein n=1 Tax=Mangrovactinospora gilvigrisea TaxID=1428644 RepID=A0A1J7BL90_9ACTN|nr:hypothetical protein [Mangrovactinospora gilvigrisea]OIV39349.1 hypothetical protein BIV57_00440 [Mangrovactinospora gilvigrisea]
MSEVELPSPVRLMPTYDAHVWPFTNALGHLTHVRLRVWPTRGGGHLAIGTDYMLGGGLVNMAESFYAAVVREFGASATVVRHFPARTMLAGRGDKFQLLLEPDERGVSDVWECTEDVVELLGPGVLGFPGDAAPGPGREPGPAAQSVYLGRLHAALLRLDQVHGTVVPKDVEPADQMTLATTALERLTKYIANIVLDDDTGGGAERERRLARVVDGLQQQAMQLMFLADETHAQTRKGRNEV